MTQGSYLVRSQKYISAIFWLLCLTLTSSSKIEQEKLSNVKLCCVMGHMPKYVCGFKFISLPREGYEDTNTNYRSGTPMVTTATMGCKQLYRNSIVDLSICKEGTNEFWQFDLQTLVRQISINVCQWDKYNWIIIWLFQCLYHRLNNNKPRQDTFMREFASKHWGTANCTVAVIDSLHFNDKSWFLCQKMRTLSFIWIPQFWCLTNFQNSFVIVTKFLTNLLF